MPSLLTESIELTSVMIIVVKKNLGGLCDYNACDSCGANGLYNGCDSCGANGGSSGYCAYF